MKKLTLRDVNKIKEHAKEIFLQYPARGRLLDMHRDLTVDESRVLAFYEAFLILLEQEKIPPKVEITNPDSDCLPD